MKQMQISQTTLVLYALILLLVGAAIGAWVTRLIMKYPFGRNPLTGRDTFVGKKAVVVNKKPKILRVAINSQVWNAECEEMESVRIGDTVTVMDMDNLTLRVEKRRPNENMLSGDAMPRDPAS